jgi:hypothetical protein
LVVAELLGQLLAVPEQVVQVMVVMVALQFFLVLQAQVAVAAVLEMVEAV